MGTSWMRNLTLKYGPLLNSDICLVETFSPHWISIVLCEIISTQNKAIVWFRIELFNLREAREVPSGLRKDSIPCSSFSTSQPSGTLNSPSILSHNIIGGDLTLSKVLAWLEFLYLFLSTKILSLSLELTFDTENTTSQSYIKIFNYFATCIESGNIVMNLAVKQFSI